jgi:magnesium-transporting ATPase (P-type)
MAGLATAPESTDLQKRLERSEKLAGYLGLICGVGTFSALMIKFAVGKPDWGEDWSKIISFFITSISIVLCSIPEGLPLAVTISMAYSMQRMRDDQNLVKVLSACETMGNVTTICSDKTGTLTTNQMTLVQAFIGQRYFARQPQAHELSIGVHKHLVDGIVLNSDKRIVEEKMDFTTPHESWPWVGEGGATETALLSWLSRYYDPTQALANNKHNPKKLNVMQIRTENREKVINFYPFSSAKKFSATVLGYPIQDPTDATKMTLPPKATMYFKGAADRIIKRCTKYIDEQGSSRDITYKNDQGKLTTELSTRPGVGVPGMCCWSQNGETCDKWALLGRKGTQQATCCAEPRHKPADIPQDDLVQIEFHPMKVMDNMTRQGLRCIAFAYVENVPIVLKDGQLVEPVYDDLPWTLVGLVGIKDPLRLETKPSVMTIQHAGIIVRMVTGDNLDTARFIARDCGIMSSSRHVAVEGIDFRDRLADNDAYKAKNGQNNPDFVDFVNNLRVMARCHPEDKLELVKFLKNDLNQQVAVTGDGSNDSPALKASNVGLAMGIAGTDVAKAACDIIILDDNFNSIVRSVMWGRSVFDSIRKFLQFQLSVNMAALTIALVGALATGDEPLKALQLLWINLVMDTMGALAIGTEKPKAAILKRKPYIPGSTLISKIMFRNIIGQAFFQIIILLPLVFIGQDLMPSKFFTNDYNPLTGERIVNSPLLDTFIFNTFTFMQLFNEINSRKCNDELNAFDGILANAWFPALWVIAATLQVILVEFCGVFMHTKPLSWDLWLISLAIAASQLVTGFLLKLIKLDVEQGQIPLDRRVVFEGADWLEDPSVIHKMFQIFDKKKLAKAGAVSNSDDKDDKSKLDGKNQDSSEKHVPSRQVYIGNAFYAKLDEEPISKSVELSNMGVGGAPSPRSDDGDVGISYSQQ